MNVDEILMEFDNDYYNLDTLYTFHNKVKLESVFSNKQKPRRNYDFPEDNILENEELYRYIEVPKDTDGIDISLIDAVIKRRTTSLDSFKGDWTKKELLQFLNGSLGVTKEHKISHMNKNMEDEEAVLKLRAYPSGGAMYPIELYLYIKNIIGMEEGLYLFNPNTSRLIQIDSDKDLSYLESLIPCTALKIDPRYSSLEKVNVLIFLVADFRYAAHKYGILAYKLALLEAGHIGQNIQLFASALNKRSIPLGGHYDDKVEPFLRIDGKEKTCTYMFGLG